MSAGANSSAVSTLEDPDRPGYIDFSGLVDAYRRSTGCPLVESAGDVLPPDPEEDVFIAERPTPQEARLFVERSEEPFLIDPEFEEVLDGF